MKITNAMNHINDSIIVGAERKAKITRNPTWVKWVAVAACLTLIVSGIFAFIKPMEDVSANTIVAFDVNPSIELEIDKDEKVVEARALNEDAKKVLADMDLENVDIDVAVNAIVGSMLKNGYISVDRNSILVSVSGDSEKAAELQKLISADIEKLLGEKKIDASVIAQTYEKNEDVEKKAEENHISVAKATLIDKIVAAGLKDAQGKAYSYESLAGLNVNELKLLLESKSVKVEGIESSGNASTTEYISADEALQIALANAGTTKEAVKGLEVEMDHEHGKMIFDVEFDLENTEFEYEIDAKTGEILEIEKEVDDDKDDDDDEIDDKDDVITEVPAVDKDAALAAALAHAGLSKDAVRDIEVELDKENGKLVYEVSFENAEFEFDYEISADDASVIKFEKEPQDR